ncbi:NRDE family protein, partial [Xanthomonas phaseoli]
STCSSTVSMALQKGQRLREAGQFEVAAVGQIKSAGDNGTRASTIVAVDHDGHGFIHERRLGPNGSFQGETRLEIPGPR